MKAEYILKAIEAMKAAEDRLCKFKEISARDSWLLADGLMNARIDLIFYSGIKEQDVTVEE